MFGPQAKRALNPSVQVNKVRQQFADLSRRLSLYKTHQHSSPCCQHSSPLKSQGPLFSAEPPPIGPFQHQGIGHQNMDLLPSDPNCPKVIGVKPDSHTPGARYFSPQHLSCLGALIYDPWELSTLPKGVQYPVQASAPKVQRRRNDCSQ